MSLVPEVDLAAVELPPLVGLLPLVELLALAGTLDVPVAAAPLDVSDVDAVPPDPPVVSDPLVPPDVLVPPEPPVVDDPFASLVPLPLLEDAAADAEVGVLPDDDALPDEGVPPEDGLADVVEVAFASSVLGVSDFFSVAVPSIVMPGFERFEFRVCLAIASVPPMRLLALRALRHLRNWSGGRKGQAALSTDPSTVP